MNPDLFRDDVLSQLDPDTLTPAGIITQLLLDRPDLVASLTLLAPVSPYGFGGTTDELGTRIASDDPGTGGGGANPEFVAGLLAGDRTDASPNTPRSVMNTFYFADGFRADLEETYVDSMLTTEVGDDNYPGDSAASERWPGFGAGTRGVLNTMAPGYHDVSGIVAPGPGSAADRAAVPRGRGGRLPAISVDRAGCTGPIEFARPHAPDEKAKHDHPPRAPRGR